MSGSHDFKVHGTSDTPKIIDDADIKPCGGCTACCTIMGVDTLSKPTHTPCQHICPQGCSIYTNKPPECDGWECAWKSGWIEGDERRRPDKLGVMFEFRLVGGRSFLWVYEVWPNALEDSKVKYLLGRLGKEETLVLTKFGSMRVYCEPKIMAFLKAHGVGTHDIPIVPLQTLVAPDGTIGKKVTERVGKSFVVTHTFD